MKCNILIKSSTCLFCFIVFTNLLFANEGNLSICSNASYDIIYNSSCGKLLLMCYNDKIDTPVNLIDPFTLNNDGSFNFCGFADDARLSGLCDSVFISIGETDGDRTTNEGKLIELDCSSGDILRTMTYSQAISHMTINSSDEYAYVSTVGRKYSSRNHILKISLQSFQIVDELEFGDRTNDIELTPDGSKIYICTQNMYAEHPDLSVKGIGVIRTSDMEVIKRIQLPSSPYHMEISTSGDLIFVSSSYMTDLDKGADLYIIDTDTDEITERLIFNYNGYNLDTMHLAYSCNYEKLYCTVTGEPEEPLPVDGLILELDLADLSYSFIQLGDQPLGRIALAENATCCRLFAIEDEGTPVVHWIDL
jgi:hypothetical protein